jgi:Flp pilus assembly protein TadG
MRWRDEDGRSLVEFALCASTLFLITFGIMGICFALYSYNFVAEAARDASRYAMVRGSSCTGFSDCSITSAQLQTYVQNLSYPGIYPANLSATASWSPSNAPGGVVTVTVGYQFPLNIPFWPRTGTVLHMASSSQMTISQ